MTQRNYSLICQVFHAFTQLWIRCCDKMWQNMIKNGSGGGEKIDRCSIWNNSTKATKTQIIKGRPPPVTSSWKVRQSHPTLLTKLDVGAHQLCVTLLQGEPYPRYKIELCGGSHQYLPAICKAGLISITKHSLQTT